MTALPVAFSMSADQPWWSLTPSTLMPMILQLRAAKSDLSPATAPSSVVQTGVKSFGWENSSAQPSPIHSWKVIAPSVVSAVKSGAVSLIRSPMGCLRCWRTARRLAKHGDYSDQISQESFQTSQSVY